MKRRLLIGYQGLTGASDSLTGLLLILRPAFTLRLMRVHVAADALPFLSYIGVFVLSVGIACFYGAFLANHVRSTQKLEVVWLLTGITRGLVSVFIMSRILSGTLDLGWLTVAIFDGLFALLQFIGLVKGWLNHVAG